ncbi:MAG: hypothetical protein IKC03_08005 [Oscillospiraceae bacterium]|nr:hypothetical protein [Oscillospiraceae bacterium]
MEMIEKLPERKKRAPRSLPTRAVQQRYNDRRSCIELKQLLVNNFGHGGLLVTLTYDDASLPRNKSAAWFYIRRFLRKLREVRRQQEEELLFVYTTEGLHAACTDGRFGSDSMLEDRRIHHHAVINAGDIDELRDLWECGNLRSERIDAHCYQELAQYLTKEAREEGRKKPGERAWCCSRNLRREPSDRSPDREKQNDAP